MFYILRYTTIDCWKNKIFSSANLCQNTRRIFAFTAWRVLYDLRFGVKKKKTHNIFPQIFKIAFLGNIHILKVYKNTLKVCMKFFDYFKYST